MPSHQRNHTAVIRWLLFVCLLCSGSSLEAQIEAPSPVPSQEASSQSKDSSDDSELKLHNYQLKRAKAAEVLKLWKQLHGGDNTATVDERTNSIVFYSREAAATELLESLALLDSETPHPIIPSTPVLQGSSPQAPVPAKSKPAGPFVKFTFKHAKVADVLKILREVAPSDFDSDDIEGFVVDERTNSFIWKVDTVSLDFEEECKKLDTESPASLGKLKESASPYRPSDDIRSDGVSMSFQTLTISLEVDRSNTVKSLKQRYNELEQQAHQLAEKLKQSKSPSEPGRTELKAAVRKSFEARQALQRAELADLAQRMQSMQQSIDMRDKLADKVVERRVEDLLNPNLKWDLTEPTAIARTESSSKPKSIKEAVSEILLNAKVDSVPYKLAAVGILYEGKAEVGDFKEKIFEQVEAEAMTFAHFELISRRVANAAMAESRLGLKDLFVAENTKSLFPVMTKFGQSMDFLLLLRLEEVDVSRGESEGNFRLTLRLVDKTGQTLTEQIDVSKGKRADDSKQFTHQSTTGYASPQELLDAVEQHGKSGPYEDFVTLFNDEGVRDLAGCMLMQAVMQTSIDDLSRQLTFGGVAEGEPDFVAFRKVLQRWLPQSVTTAQQEAMGKGLSTIMSSTGGASPDHAALNEFVISLRESVAGIGDHRKFSIEIMQAFEKRTKRKFVFFGNADHENEWQISPFGDRAIATLIDGSPGMATTITLQQATGTWRISSLFNERIIEAQPATKSPKFNSIAHESTGSDDEKANPAKAKQSSSLPTKHDANVDLAVFDWNDLLRLLPESGTVLMMFSHEPDKREQMLPIAEKVAEEAAVELIHLPIDNWRTLFSKEATHFVLMKDRQLIGTKTGLVTEAKLKEFVAQAKDWLTPHSTGVMESSLVRVDCYISPGKDNIGSQHGPAIPITLAVVAIDGDEALLFGTEGIAEYLEKGCACVAIVGDDKGKEKQVPLEVVLTGNVPLKKPDALNDDDALVITIPFFNYDKEYIELQEAYDVGSAIYRIRGAHGLTTVKLAPFDSTPQKGERVLAGEFNSIRHHGPILGFQSPFHWQTQQNLSESYSSIYGANIHGAKMFEVLCPTIPAPSSFLFNAHGRLIGTGGLGNLTEKDKTYTALMPYAIHSVLHAGLEAIAHVGLKAALKQTLEESTSANQSTKTSATAEPKYSGHPISWWLDSYWDSATAIPKTAENIAQEYVASDAIRKLREKPECKAAIEAALAKWFASVEHEVNEIQLVRAAKCFVTAAGQEYQELAVDYLFKIWKQFPTLSWEKQIERLGEETELNDLLKQIELNDELANKFAERLTNGTSSDRSFVTYCLFFGTGLKDEKDPKVAELNTWLHNHHELFIPAFSAALKDDSEHVRWFSLWPLVGLDLKHANVLSTLTSVIESDASPKVRWLAIEMLTSKELLSVAKTQNIEITPLLIQTLQSDSSVDVRYAALGALMAMDKDSELVHATLLEWARCKERLQVEYALTLMLRNHEAGDRPQSIDELIELLSDPEWGTTLEVKQNNYRWARQYAIANLGEYAAHAHRAIPTLEAELARKNKDTLSFATEALDHVRGYCPDLPIDQLQGEWEFVSVNRPSSTTAFFDFPLHPGGVYPGMGREIRTASHELPPTIITVTGTQLKIGDRVVAEISHHRKLGGFVMLLDPDGRKLHCNGSFRIAGGPSPSVGAATSPQKVTLEICELRNEYDSTQATKQTYELQVKELH